MNANCRVWGRGEDAAADQGSRNLGSPTLRASRSTKNGLSMLVRKTDIRPSILASRVPKYGRAGFKAPTDLMLISGASSSIPEIGPGRELNKTRKAYELRYF